MMERLDPSDPGAGSPHLSDRAPQYDRVVVSLPYRRPTALPQALSKLLPQVPATTYRCQMLMPPTLLMIIMMYPPVALMKAPRGGFYRPAWPEPRGRAVVPPLQPLILPLPTACVLSALVGAPQLPPPTRLSPPTPPLPIACVLPALAGVSPRPPVAMCRNRRGVLKNTGWLFKPPVVFALPTHCTL